MEIKEILSESESGLERKFDNLDLYWMDDERGEENNKFTASIRKRHAPRKWLSTGFDPKKLKLSHGSLGVSEKIEIVGNKAYDYFRIFCDNENC